MPQPFHIGSEAGLGMAALITEGAQAPIAGSTAGAAAPGGVSGVPEGAWGFDPDAVGDDKNAATACFSAAGSGWPCAAMTPPGSSAAMICATERALRLALEGERDESGASWQDAQRSL